MNLVLSLFAVILCSGKADRRATLPIQLRSHVDNRQLIHTSVRGEDAGEFEESSSPLTSEVAPRGDQLVSRGAIFFFFLGGSPSAAPSRGG